MKIDRQFATSWPYIRHPRRREPLSKLLSEIDLTNGTVIASIKGEVKIGLIPFTRKINAPQALLIQSNVEF